MSQKKDEKTGRAPFDFLRILQILMFILFYIYKIKSYKLFTVLIMKNMLFFCQEGGGLGKYQENSSLFLSFPVFIMKFIYSALFHPEEDGGFYVEFPGLDGCFSCGDDAIECYEMAEEALKLWIATGIGRGRQLPAFTSPETIRVPKGGFVSLVKIDFDPLAYYEECKV